MNYRTHVVADLRVCQIARQGNSHTHRIIPATLVPSNALPCVLADTEVCHYTTKPYIPILAFFDCCKSLPQFGIRIWFIQLFDKFTEIP